MIRSFALPGIAIRVAGVMAVAVVVSGAHERDGQALTIHHSEGTGVHGMVQTDWQSRYFSEGRDALDGDSLWSKSIELNWESWSWGLWHGESPDQDYDELQLSMAYSRSFGDWEAYVGYTHFRFPFDGSYDHEVGLGLIWSGCPLGIEYALDAYHSYEADGSFVEATATREWQVSEKVTVSLSGVFGVNQGYVGDGHDGANHIAAQFGISYAFTESVTLHSHVTSSWGINRDSSLVGDAALEDFVHAGLGIDWAF